METNPYTQNLNRLEFMMTLACTGRCKHCSEGEHSASGEHIDGDAAARAVRSAAGIRKIESLMTFGGEPLLYPDAVCKIHAAARDCGIPKRQLITNGYFTKDFQKMRDTAAELIWSGVTDILLSADAFHQEIIPLSAVRSFAETVKSVKYKGITIRVHPAWLVSETAENPYNAKTREIIGEFAGMGIEASEGNIIFPDGNALKYLKEYFDPNAKYENPYTEDPRDIRAVCVSPDGSVLGGNIYSTEMSELIESYSPQEK
ncbi:MAG: radical SAM protein [Oscillospiraceae bacterium]|nr:radical SAM protein [Oscillospiraceae bacterium]